MSLNIEFSFGGINIPKVVGSHEHFLGHGSLFDSLFVFAFGLKKVNHGTDISVEGIVKGFVVLFVEALEKFEEVHF